MKKHTIIGTAGHIDHGKTALIKALTGINTDQLKEEKERGITIDIGFAYWKKNVTIIDVPGHEKFIRNMVAGVSTIDFFILVIAADDGIMPQTIEHLDILHFFNINNGIVVINKIDLVDSEWLDLIESEVSELLEKYGLKNTPMIKVSATTEKNIEQFKQLVDKKIDNLNTDSDDRPFRLTIDRSFSVKGFGTVTTGTVLSGTLNIGDEVQILPTGFKTKVRGLQEHTETVNSVQVGDRAAINLQNTPKEGIKRGDVIITPNTMQPINTFIGLVKTISDITIKVKNLAKVRIHVGTSEQLGTLYWFENDKLLMPDKYYHVLIKLDNPVAAARRDAFLIRLHSPMLTLAGGKILSVNPPKLKINNSDWLSFFKIVEADDILSIIENIIKNENLNPVSLSFLQHSLFEEIGLINNSITTLVSQKKIRVLTLKGTDTYLHKDNFEEFCEKILVLIKKYHELNPTKAGINLQEIIGEFKQKKILAEVFEAALTKLRNSNLITLNQNIYALADFKLRVSKDTNIAKNELLELLFNKRYETPTLDEISEIINIPINEIYTLLGVLKSEKTIVKINNNIYLHSKRWNELIVFLRNHFSEQNELEVSLLKDFLKTSRKYAIPIFEYLDSMDFTRRKENVRIKGNAL